MTTLLQDIHYFHGTGYVSHDFGTNKYQDNINGVRNTLEEILKNGLQTFPDPLNHDFSATISVTDDPIYALLYSLLYSEKGTSKNFGIRRGREWGRILWKIFTEANTFSIKKYRASDGRLVGLKKFKRWTHSFNNKDYNHPLGGFRGMIWGESNIEGNFPVVIGIKEIRKTREMPGWNEVRVTEGISLENIGAIFVPRDKIHSIPYTSIPILPLEDFIENIN